MTRLESDGCCSWESQSRTWLETSRSRIRSRRTIDRSAGIPIHNARVYARKPDSCEPCRCICPLLVYSISLDVMIRVRSKLILRGQHQMGWRLELHGDDLSSTYRTAIRCFGTLSPRSSATEGYLDSRCRETLSCRRRCWS